MAEKKDPRSKKTKAAKVRKSKAAKPGKPKAATRKKQLVKGDERYPIYDSAAKRDAYKVGDVVKFKAVRNWALGGELVEAYGKVVGVGIFDKDVPYIEISFSDVKKLNKKDLGRDVRRFILEQK